MCIDHSKTVCSLQELSAWLERKAHFTEAEAFTTIDHPCQATIYA